MLLNICVGFYAINNKCIKCIGFYAAKYMCNAKGHYYHHLHYEQVYRKGILCSYMVIITNKKYEEISHYFYCFLLMK